MPSLMAILGLNGSSFKAGLDKAKSQAREAGKEIASGLAAGTGAGAMLGLERITESLVEKTKELVKSTVEYGEQISITAQRLGMTTDAVQAWDYALKMNGSSIQSATGFFEKLEGSRKKAMNGDGDAIASFRALGVSIEDLKSKRVEDLGLQIAQVFQTGDPQKLVPDLREVGGRGAGEMVAAFREGLADLVNSAKDAGVVMSNEMVEGFRSAADQTKTLWQQAFVAMSPFVSALVNQLLVMARGAEAIGKYIMGSARGGRAGGAAAVAAYRLQLAEEDKAEEERRKKRAHPLATGGVEEGESKKAQREQERSAEKILRLKEELLRKQQAADLAGMTGAEKLFALEARRAGIVEAMGKSKTEEGRLNAMMDIADLDREIEGARKEAGREDKPKGHGRGQDLNQLQRIGAYAAERPLEVTQVDLARKTEGHLREIKEHLANGGGGRKVVF